MEIPSYQPLIKNIELPQIYAPKLNGVGDPNMSPIYFNSCSYLLAKTATESGLEGVLPLMTASIKKDGLIICTIPFYYKGGVFKIHSNSLFSFVMDESLTAFQEYIKKHLREEIGIIP
jgi:hypothetical protein